MTDTVGIDTTSPSADTIAPSATMLDVTLCFRGVTPERSQELINRGDWSVAARSDVFSERDAAQAQNAKLREALEKIVSSPSRLPDEEDTEAWATLASERREIARAALPTTNGEGRPMNQTIKVQESSRPVAAQEWAMRQAMPIATKHAPAGDHAARFALAADIAEALQRVNDAACRRNRT